MTFSERGTKAILNLRHNPEWLAIHSDMQKHYNELVVLTAHAQTADHALIRAGALREFMALLSGIETAQRSDTQPKR